jgi:hypothetical protein
MDFGDLDFSSDAEWKKWESNYESIFLILQAQNENIELFCFGTELGNAVAKRPEYWSQLIKKIKKIYSGN